QEKGGLGAAHCIVCGMHLHTINRHVATHYVERSGAECIGSRQSGAACPPSCNNGYEKKKQASKGTGRTGFNFTLRMTPAEREALTAMMKRSGGPRELGPWLIYQGLRGE